VILVDIERVGVSRPDRPLFSALSLAVSTGDRLGLVGINGTGKSTLLRVVAGVTEPEEGVVRRGRGVRVSFLDQHPRLPEGTVREAVGEGWEAAAILDRVGMSSMADTDVRTLSGGQAKRVALARTLVTECDLLVLDEPTNHLDIAAIGWLEDRLAAFRGGLLLVTHDRHILDRVTTRVVELDRGASYVHDGGYQGYLDARAAREEQAVTAEATRRNLARTELAWLRRGAPARTRKPKARIASATALVEGRAQSGARVGDLRLGNAGTARAPAPRLGDKVIRLEGVGHRFDDAPWLFDGFDLDLVPDGRLGIVGANGTGKSTLLDILAGRIAPARGTVERGSTVRVGYYDQFGRELDPAQRVRDVVAGPTRTADWEDARLMEQFWFDSDAQWAPVGTLSGGERRRLQLLLVLAERPNVLLLDEPTNDLDLDTLRALEDFLESWAGSLVVVTHDRAFLERAVTDFVALHGDGRAGRVAGGYDAWAATVTATAGRANRATAPASSVPKAAVVDPKAKARTPSTLRRLIGLAEQEMSQLGAQRQGLVLQLAGAGGDYPALTRLSHEMAAVEARLADAEHRWLELSEELGG
jgi:ATP-binding cassette subfamily F protein uup